MKLRDIIKGAAAIAGTVNPAVGLAIGVVNEFLPEKDKLPETATGSQVGDALDGLPVDVRATLMERDIDLRIAQEEGWTTRYEAMCRGDGQTTRPKIALMLTKVLIFEILAFTVWCFFYPDMIGDAGVWAAFGTLTGVPAGAILSYFGNLRKEQSARVAGLSGHSPLGAIGGIVKAFKGI